MRKSDRICCVILLGLALACLSGCGGNDPPPHTPGWQSLGAAINAVDSVDGLSRLVIRNNQPYLAYTDTANANRITLTTYTGGLWVKVPTAGTVTTGGGGCAGVAVEPAAGAPYVLYHDSAANRASFKKYDGAWDFYPASTGTGNGGQGFSGYPGVESDLCVGADQAIHLALTLFYGTNPSGTAYYYRPAVYALDAGAWTLLDPGHLTDLGNTMPGVRIARYGSAVFIAYRDSSLVPTVRKIGTPDAPIWTPLGNFLDGVDAFDFCLDADGYPYLIYADTADTHVGARIYTNVVTPGWHALPDPAADLPEGHQVGRLAACTEGSTLYIAYHDETAKIVVVKRFVVDHWETVGGPGFAAADVDRLSLCVQGGVPYLAFQTLSSPISLKYGFTVMKYE